LSDALRQLDEESAAVVRPAVRWLDAHADGAGPALDTVTAYLDHELVRQAGPTYDVHDVAWALGDLLERAGRTEEAALCRAPGTHQRLSVQRWAASFGGAVPARFWRPALDAVSRLPEVPQRVRLSLVGATGLLEEVGDGLHLTDDGWLPPASVRRLDDRFRWTEEFPWTRTEAERDVPPLAFLRRHLVAQGLLEQRDARLVPTTDGAAARTDLGVLWRAVVAPRPRWTHAFELDILGVMAASLLRAPDFAPGRVAEELSHVLAAKWRPGTDRAAFDRASVVVQEWYQVGVPLGWWDTGRGPADRRPNAFGRAAAASLLRGVVRPG
jgi:hypothetical protein